MRGNAHVRFGGPGRGNGSIRKVETAPRSDPYYGLRDGEIRCLAQPIEE